MSQVQNDPLLGCLVYLTAHYGHAKTPSSLIADLPYSSKGMTIEIFQKAAISAKIRTKTEKRNLQSLSQEILPCVLILKNNQAVVLLENQDGKLKVFRPSEGKKITLNLETLEKEFSGYVVHTHPMSERRRDARHWFWSIIRDNRTVYNKVIIAALLINIFGLIGPLFIMNVYDRVIPNNAFETGWVLAIGAFIIFGFDFIIRTLRGYFIDLAGRRIDVIVGGRIYDHLLNMKLMNRPKSSGGFGNMLREFESIKEFCTSATLTSLVDLPFSILFIFVIYLLSGNIALILLAIMALVALSSYLIQIPLKNLVKDSIHSGETKNGLLMETINGLETIKLTRSDGLMRARYEVLLGKSAEVGQKSRFLSSMAINISTFMQQATSIIIVLFGMYMVKDGTLTIGALIASVILGGKAIAPIGQIAALITRFHSVKESFLSLDKIMISSVDRPNDKNFLHRPDLKGEIRFTKVGFSYPSDSRKILDSISFLIKSGERVGIVGRIGSGKSTITKIISGLYDPTDGDIFIDGTDYRQIDPADLRRAVGYIAQDTILFSGTIRENIAAGYPQATDEEILEVSKMSGVHEFVSRHPMGYDAPVGERGDGLSGGQKQCIAMARALITNTKILLADEPTNHMDVQAEQNFSKQIDGLSKDKTLILITHRYNLLQLVDRIIVIDNGVVLADGPRDKILDVLGKGMGA